MDWSVRPGLFGYICLGRHVCLFYLLSACFVLVHGLVLWCWLALSFSWGYGYSVCSGLVYGWTMFMLAFAVYAELISICTYSLIYAVVHKFMHTLYRGRDHPSVI